MNVIMGHMEKITEEQMLMAEFTEKMHYGLEAVKLYLQSQPFEFKIPPPALPEQIEGPVEKGKGQSIYRSSPTIETD